MIDMSPDTSCLFLTGDTIALVLPSQHTLVTEMYLVLILLTRANRQTGVMCIPVF